MSDRQVPAVPITGKLPANFLGSINRTLQQSTALGGAQYATLQKSGVWTFGQEQNLIGTDTLVALDILNAMEGFVAWGDGAEQGKKLGEVMKSIFGEGEPIQMPTDGKPWKPQYSVNMKILTDEHKGADLLYATTSVGGVRVMRDYLSKVELQAQMEDQAVVAIVHLLSSPYKHPTYGQIFNPVFDYVEWKTLGSTEVPEDEPEAPAKKRTRKK